MTDDEIRALLDEATPGPWRADGEPWNRIVWSSADNRICFMAHSNGLDDARDIATSNLAAAAPALANAALEARAEVTTLRDRLAVVGRERDALVQLVKEITDPKASPSHGDPVMIRDYARDRLAALQSPAKEQTDE